MIAETTLRAKHPETRDTREGQRQRILALLEMRGGPMTRLEVSVDTGLPINIVCWRFRDLRIANMITRYLDRDCRISGERVQTWWLSPKPAAQMTLAEVRNAA